MRLLEGGIFAGGKLGQKVPGVAIAVALALASSAVLAGNGAPCGAHYNLNIIGVEKDKTGQCFDVSAHRGRKNDFARDSAGRAHALTLQSRTVLEQQIHRTLQIFRRCSPDGL